MAWRKAGEKKKKRRESENVKMWFRGKKVFCLGREHDCRIYSVDLRAPCFYEYTEKTMGNTKLLRSRTKRLRVKWAEAEERWRGEEMLG